MNQDIPRTITDDEISTYHKDGVVLLKQMFDAEWIALLTQGMTANYAAPTNRSRVWDRDDENRTVFYDSQAWQRIEQYRQYIFESPAANIAGQLMRSKEINFYFDAVFIRSPSCQFETPWHQDEPYWSVDGYNTCTIWMPLTPVSKESALAFVPGSHLLDVVYDQYNFGNLNPDDQIDIDQVDFSAIAETNFPNINDDPTSHGVVSWDMQPGDCVVFNGRTMHGGSGKLEDDQDLRVFTTKWLGDDVQIKFRDCGMDPDHSEIMTQYGLKPGDRPGTDLYPKILQP